MQVHRWFSNFMLLTSLYCAFLSRTTILHILQMITLIVAWTRHWIMYLFMNKHLMRSKRWQIMTNLGNDLRQIMSQHSDILSLMRCDSYSCSFHFHQMSLYFQYLTYFVLKIDINWLTSIHRLLCFPKSLSSEYKICNGENFKEVQGRKVTIKEQLCQWYGRFATRCNSHWF